MPRTSRQRRATCMCSAGDLSLGCVHGFPQPLTKPTATGTLAGREHQQTYRLQRLTSGKRPVPRPRHFPDFSDIGSTNSPSSRHQTIVGKNLLLTSCCPVKNGSSLGAPYLDDTVLLGPWRPKPRADFSRRQRLRLYKCLAAPGV